MSMLVERSMPCIPEDGIDGAFPDRKCGFFPRAICRGPDLSKTNVSPRGVCREPRIGKSNVNDINIS